LAETHQDKLPTHESKSTTNVLAPRTTIQTFTGNKILVYKCILKPIWTYGIQLWVCTKPSNKKVLERFQSNVLRSITNAPWYVSNVKLHKDIQTPFVTEEIKKYSTTYHSRLIRQGNSQVTELSNTLHVKRD
jgi:hypothetical protein